jgi:hypothetical protein
VATWPCYSSFSSTRRTFLRVTPVANPAVRSQRHQVFAQCDGGGASKRTNPTKNLLTQPVLAIIEEFNRAWYSGPRQGGDSQGKGGREKAWQARTTGFSGHSRGSQRPERPGSGSEARPATAHRWLSHRTSPKSDPRPARILNK